MNTIDSLYYPVIEVAGRKLYDVLVLFKGTQMPVAVYLVKDQSGKVFNLCVCFEKTPIEMQNPIALTPSYRI